MSTPAPADTRISPATSRLAALRGNCLDIGRLRQDTGYQPAYDTDRAVAEYLAWLRAGHER